jgi:hypothetical protein
MIYSHPSRRTIRPKKEEVRRKRRNTKKPHDVKRVLCSVNLTDWDKSHWHIGLKNTGHAHNMKKTELSQELLFRFRGRSVAADG